MISPRQAKRDRAALLKALHRDQRRAFLARLKKLREEEAAAKLERREALARARARCVTLAEEANAAAKEAYRHALELAKAAKLATRNVARDQCAIGKQHARDEGAHRIAAAKRERDEERRFAAELVRLERGAKESEKERKSARRGERRAESDDEVRSNLEPELVPLFERVKKTIRGSDRMTRTEAFRQYAEENPGEVYAAQEAEAEKALRRDVRKVRRAPRAALEVERELVRELGGRRRARAAGGRGDLTDLPF